MAPKLKIVISSTRPGRNGPKVARWVEAMARDHGGFDVELVDLADYALPLLDEPEHPAKQDYKHAHTRKWAATVAEADAFLFVTPEYNFSPPASVVNAIQYVLAEWNRKVAGVVCYGGVSGGLRSSQELRLMLSNVGVMPLKQVVPLPFVFRHFEGDALQANEQMEGGMKGLLAELALWAPALKELREKS